MVLSVLKADSIIIVSMFATADNSLMIQDMFSPDAGLSQLIALDMPYYCFAKEVFTDLSLI